MTKRTLAGLSATICLLLLPSAALSEDNGIDLSNMTFNGIEVSGTVDIGVRHLDNDSGSSKFNEYRDLENDAYVNKLYLDVFDPASGRYFDLRERNVSRDDQELYMELGSTGGWSLDVSWNETPHLLSNKARTPYIMTGPGSWRVPTQIVNDIQISDVADASTWTSADAGAGGVGEDARIASVLADTVHDVDLGLQREEGRVGFNYNLGRLASARVEFRLENKDGSIVTGAPIGDRPPRSMTVQLPEPVDYRTEEIRLTLDRVTDTYQVQADYLYSEFTNHVDAMDWNSLFHEAGFFFAAGDDFDRIRIGRTTEYSTTGKIALSPDNTYHNLAVKGGFDLPMQSRLNLALAYGKIKQDSRLLPYATSDFGGTEDVTTLPRTSVDAEIKTTLFDAAYMISLVDRLNARVHYRYYDLDNDTPQSEFDYFTQDTDSQNYRNERKNIPYGLKQNNYGVDLSYYLGSAGTIGVGYEREEIERPHREVNETDEDIYKVTYRAQPHHRVSLRAGYTRGDRDGSAYNGEISDDSYHYDTSDASNQAEPDNPLLGFGNHPSLRKYDVANRVRDVFDVNVGVMPTDDVTVNLAFSYRDDNYASPTSSTIARVWDSVDGEFKTDVAVDPTQLGLLEEEAKLYAADAVYTPIEELYLSAFYSREEMESTQRGRFLNENHRIDQTSGTIEGGTKDWQDTTGQWVWDAAVTDTTDTVGISAGYVVIDDILDVAAGYSYSQGVVEIDYTAGSAIAEDDTTSGKDWGEWTSPEDVKFRSSTVNAGIRYRLTGNLALGFNYTYERYEVRDWQQEAKGAHQNPLSEQYVADQDPETQGTSQDRVGSRLVRLAGLLAPSYEAHVGFLTLAYSW